MGTILNESTEDLITRDESLEKNNKQKEYIDYIKDHVFNVQRAYANYFLPLLDKDNITPLLSDELFKNAIRRASIQIEHHDDSKWTDEEFDGYREKYYPTALELADAEFQEKVEEKAEKAWVSHYKNNSHHPKFWMKEDGTIEDMNLESIIEMICDWLSFNIKSGNPEGVIQWYEEKATHEKDEMTDRTKQIVEELLYNVIFK